MKKYFKLELIFIRQYLKKLMEYKGDFLLGAIGFLFGQAFQIIFLNIIFSQIPSLNGYTYYEVLFIYAFALLPKGIDHLFTDNLWMVGYRIVRKGEFDKYLTRPINSLFYVIMETFQIDAIGELIVSIVLFCVAIPNVTINFKWYTIPLAIVSVFFATMIYVSLKTATAAISFWTKQSGHITHMLYMMNDFSKYPVTIYNNFVRIIITFVIPFAFTAYFPSMFILTGENPLFNVGGTVIAGTVLFIIAVLIWNKGIKAYESAGS